MDALNTTPVRRTAGLAALSLALLLGCGHAPVATLSDDAVVAPAVEDVLRERRQVQQALSSDPLAEEVRPELAQAVAWLDRAEMMAAAEEVDAPRLTLLLEAIEGQLVMIKTHFDRRKAEQAAGLGATGGQDVGN